MVSQKLLQCGAIASLYGSPGVCMESIAGPEGYAGAMLELEEGWAVSYPATEQKRIRRAARRAGVSIKIEKVGPGVICVRRVQ